MPYLPLLAMCLLAIMTTTGCMGEEDSVGDAPTPYRVAIVGIDYQLSPPTTTANRHIILAEVPGAEITSPPSKALTLFLDRMTDRFLIKSVPGIGPYTLVAIEELSASAAYQSLPHNPALSMYRCDKYQAVVIENTPQWHAFLEENNLILALSILYIWTPLSEVDYQLSLHITGLSSTKKILHFTIPLDLRWSQLQNKGYPKSLPKQTEKIRDGISGTILENPYLGHSLNRKRYENALEKGWETLFLLLKSTENL